jgi:site-specific recombinase XerD
MSTINFYLDKPDRKKQHPIVLAYVARGRRFRYYTKLKISEPNWDNKIQRVRKSFVGAEEMNSILETLQETIKQIEREALFKRVPITMDQVRRLFEIAIGKQKSADDFHSVYNLYLVSVSGRITEGTAKAFAGSYNKLKSFENFSNYNLTFESINKNFYDLYVDYLIKECQHLNNSVGRFIKNLKFFMNYATEIGINKNMQFRKFKVFDEEADLIYLTHDELMRLFRLQIENESLYNVRENFCFECFTGLRFSDVSKLENVHIEENVLRLKTLKTKTSIMVPLNQYALEILNRNKNKYGNRPLPPCFSNQKTNVYLKTLAKTMELNTIVHLVKFSGARRIELNIRKHDLLVTHTARRTFITLSLEKGMRPEIVMQIVGIKKWETLKRYIKITDTAKIVEMNAKWNETSVFKII